MVQKDRRSLSEALAHFVRCMCADHRVGALARVCLMTKRAIHKKCAKGVTADSFTATQVLRLANLERETYGTTNLRAAILAKLLAAILIGFAFFHQMEARQDLRRHRRRLRDETEVTA